MRKYVDYWTQVPHLLMATLSPSEKARPHFLNTARLSPRSEASGPHSVNTTEEPVGWRSTLFVDTPLSPSGRMGPM